MDEDKQLEERLRQDDKQALETVYIKYRQAFIGFMRQQGLSESDALDVYQESIIALHQNFVSRQLQLQSSSLKTYLFGIGKYKMLDRIKAAQPVSTVPHSTTDYTEINMEEESLTHEQELLFKHFSQLGESCQRLLKLFYYRGLSIKEIVALTDYKDDNTVKAYKSRCLKQLKKLIKPS